MAIASRPPKLQASLSQASLPKGTVTSSRWASSYMHQMSGNIDPAVSNCSSKTCALVSCTLECIKIDMSFTSLAFCSCLRQYSWYLQRIANIEFRHSKGCTLIQQQCIMAKAVSLAPCYYVCILVCTWSQYLWWSGIYFPYISLPCISSWQWSAFPDPSLARDMPAHM